MPAEEQVVVLYAGVKGYLDKVATADIAKFETEYMNYIKSKHGSLLATIKSEGHLTDKTNAEVAQVLEEFIPQSGLVAK